ncbi:MAG TPA: 30S ribosomal protein S20 [Fibrobacteria bacterium]|nr:30S ribosomal protein S20 [Fibrobacteria bacterium]
MPNHKSAIKRVITSEKARLANRAVRSAIKTSLKKIRTADKKEAILAEVPVLFSMLDKAARRNRAGITKNTVSNYKRKIHALIASKK